MQGLNDDDRTFPSSMVSVPFPEGARRILLRSLRESLGVFSSPLRDALLALKSSTHPQETSSIPGQAPNTRWHVSHILMPVFKMIGISIIFDR